MEKTTVIGISVGIACVCVTIFLGGSITSFLHLPSAFIVFGGTIAATVVAYPAKRLKNLTKIFKLAFQKDEVDIQEDIELVVNIANIARREGLLALEGEIEGIDNDFLKKGVMLIVDGADTELIKSVLQTEIYFLQERHGQNQQMIGSMDGYAPAFGMIGTLIGLINMLKNLNDPGSLGPGMSTALITTFYGTLLSNMFFSPLGRKLKARTENECLQKEMLMEGLLSIQDGENPRIIREKLISFVSRSDDKKEVSEKPEVMPEPNEVSDELEE